MERMNKLTALGAAPGGFRAAAAGRWDGEASRKQRLVGMHDPGGERRRLFGVGEGHAEAVAKQRMDSRDRDARRCKRGLHEPAKRTKNCTKPLLLAFAEPLASLRRESQVFIPQA